MKLNKEIDMKLNKEIDNIDQDNKNWFKSNKSDICFFNTKNHDFCQPWPALSVCYVASDAR